MQKHTPSKLSELESQLAQLEIELKKAKEQLTSSEALKRRAQQEAEETKEELLVMSARLEESQQQLLELSNSEDSRVKELRKLSQERDRVWQSEVEAIQKQHSMDSAALASALNEIQKLKRQLEMAAESEATQSMRAESAHTEIEHLQVELSETFSLVENMRKQLNECKGSEAHALEVAREAQVQLEETMKTAENLRLDGIMAKEAYNNLVSELEHAKSEVASLENLVRKLKEELEIKSRNSLDALEETLTEDAGGDKKNETIELKGEIDSLKLEIGHLKSALEASELRYQEEYIQSTLQIRNAYDQVEQAKLDSRSREAEFEAELKKANGTIEELKAEMMTKETMLKNISENNKELSIKIKETGTSPKYSELEEELKKMKEELDNLKVALMAKETQFQDTREENEKLKEEIHKREKASEEADALKDAAKASEKEALMKLGCLTEEAYESSQRVARVSEQLDAAQTANAELEAELRRLKVQSDQWRKAAEAAATILSTGGNGKIVDRPVSLDSSYNTLASKMDSPLSDDLDDDSPKKKNGNMLKKIGVLWKKGGQK